MDNRCDQWSYVFPDISLADITSQNPKAQLITVGQLYYKGHFEISLLIIEGGINENTYQISSVINTNQLHAKALLRINDSNIYAIAGTSGKNFFIAAWNNSDYKFESHETMSVLPYGREKLMDLKMTSGSIVAAGYAFNNHTNHEDIFVVQLNASLGVQNSYLLDSGSKDYATFIAQGNISEKSSYIIGQTWNGVGYDLLIVGLAFKQALPDFSFQQVSLLHQNIDPYSAIKYKDQLIVVGTLRSKNANQAFVMALLQNKILWTKHLSNTQSCITSIIRWRSYLLATGKYSDNTLLMKMGMNGSVHYAKLIRYRQKSFGKLLKLNTNNRVLLIQQKGNESIVTCFDPNDLTIFGKMNVNNISSELMNDLEKRSTLIDNPLNIRKTSPSMRNEKVIASNSTTTNYTTCRTIEPSPTPTHLPPSWMPIAKTSPTTHPFDSTSPASTNPLHSTTSPSTAVTAGVPVVHTTFPSNKAVPLPGSTSLPTTVPAPKTITTSLPVENTSPTTHPFDSTSPASTNPLHSTISPSTAVTAGVPVVHTTFPSNKAVPLPGSTSLPTTVPAPKTITTSPPVENTSPTTHPFDSTSPASTNPLHSTISPSTAVTAGVPVVHTTFPSNKAVPLPGSTSLPTTVPAPKTITTSLPVENTSPTTHPFDSTSPASTNPLHSTISPSTAVTAGVPVVHTTFPSNKAVPLPGSTSLPTTVPAPKTITTSPPVENTSPTTHPFDSTSPASTNPLHSTTSPSTAVTAGVPVVHTTFPSNKAVPLPGSTSLPTTVPAPKTITTSLPVENTSPTTHPFDSTSPASTNPLHSTTSPSTAVTAGVPVVHTTFPSNKAVPLPGSTSLPTTVPAPKTITTSLPVENTSPTTHPFDSTSPASTNPLHSTISPSTAVTAGVPVVHTTFPSNKAVPLPGSTSLPTTVPAPKTITTSLPVENTSPTTHPFDSTSPASTNPLHSTTSPSTAVTAGVPVVHTTFPSNKAVPLPGSTSLPTTVPAPKTITTSLPVENTSPTTHPFDSTSPASTNPLHSTISPSTAVTAGVPVVHTTFPSNKAVPLPGSTSLPTTVPVPKPITTSPPVENTSPTTHPFKRASSNTPTANSNYTYPPYFFEKNITLTTFPRHRHMESPIYIIIVILLLCPSYLIWAKCCKRKQNKSPYHPIPSKDLDSGLEMNIVDNDADDSGSKQALIKTNNLC